LPTGFHTSRKSTEAPRQRFDHVGIASRTIMVLNRADCRLLRDRTWIKASQHPAGSGMASSRALDSFVG
jgi:hypothetical protein